jgi:hypothetical protein
MVTFGCVAGTEDRNRMWSALRELGIMWRWVPRDVPQPVLKPTVYVPARRGEDVTWQDMVVRRV